MTTAPAGPAEGSHARPAPVRRIKVYGERNSGTNYLEQFLARNLEVAVAPGNDIKLLRLIYTAMRYTLPHGLAFDLVEAHRDLRARQKFDRFLGWKHAQTPCLPAGTSAYPTDTAFVSLTKNPYAWLLSLYKRPYQSKAMMAHREASEKPPFSTFLSTPWPTVEREHGPRCYENPVVMWNAKVASYARLSEHGPHLHLRYEDLLEAPEALLERVAKKFDLARRANAVADVERSTKPGGSSRASYRDYYLNELWRSRLSSADIRFINDHLDFDLVRRTGYEVLEP